MMKTVVTRACWSGTTAAAVSAAAAADVRDKDVQRRRCMRRTKDRDSDQQRRHAAETSFHLLPSLHWSLSFTCRNQTFHSVSPLYVITHKPNQWNHDTSNASSFSIQKQQKRRVYYR